MHGSGCPCVELTFPALPPPPQVFTLDHDIQNTTPKNLKKYAEIAAFAQEHGVDAYPAGRGIGHQAAVF